MKIKITQAVGNASWVLAPGQIVEADSYPDAQNWLRAGIAVEVPEEIETASLEDYSVETASEEKPKRKKKAAE